MKTEKFPDETVNYRIYELMESEEFEKCKKFVEAELVKTDQPTVMTKINECYQDPRLIQLRKAQLTFIQGVISNELGQVAKAILKVKRGISIREDLKDLEELDNWNRGLETEVCDTLSDSMPLRCMVKSDTVDDNQLQISNYYSYLGTLYHKQGDENRFEECFKKALEIRIGLFGHIDPSTLCLLYELSDEFLNKRKFDAAMSLHTKFVSELNKSTEAV